MPMMALFLMFPPQSIPSAEIFRRRFVVRAGGRVAKQLDDITIDGAKMTVCSMSRIALMYAWKTGEDLGGMRERPGTSDPVSRPPAWVERPWSSYGLMERIRIHLGQYHP